MPIYSHSRLATYETCPHQFKMRYIEKPDVEKIKGIEAFVGSRVHDVLEKLYSELILSKLNSLEGLLQFYESIWRKNWNETIRISSKEFTKENYLETGKRAIEDYYKRYHPFNQNRPLATEFRYIFKLGNEYTFESIVDRLDITEEGIYEIHDYKTGKRLITEDQIQKDRQLALYHIGIKQKFSDAERVRLVWHYLTFDREFSLEKNEAELREIEADAIQIISRIESDTEYKPKEGPLCGYCDYPVVCPAQKHIAKVEKLDVEEFLDDDGVSLANQYIELKARASELKPAIEAIREKIIAYANREGLTGIRGSDHILKINLRDALKWPSKNDTELYMLEDIIRKSGKWDEVSKLDKNKLEKIILESMWDKELVRMIRKYSEDSKSTRINISGIKEDD